jgi:hypothetical protein
MWKMERLEFEGDVRIHRNQKSFRLRAPPVRRNLFFANADDVADLSVNIKTIQLF